MMTGIVTGALLAGCGSEGNPEIRQAGIVAVADFKSTYGCDVPTSVKVEKLDIEANPALGQGAPSIVAGTAEPGVITLDPVLNKIEQNMPGALLHSALHESAHACTHELRYAEPYLIAGAGIRMIGAVGLSAVGIDAAGETQNFALIEEGAAELLASSISNFTSNGPGFSNLAGITQELIQKHGITLQELQDYQERSDLIGFVATIKGLTKQQVSAPVIEGFFNYYIVELRRRSTS